MIYYAKQKNSWTVTCNLKYYTVHSNKTFSLIDYCKKDNNYKLINCLNCNFRKLILKYARTQKQRGRYNYKNEIFLHNKLGKHLILFNEL